MSLKNRAHPKARPIRPSQLSHCEEPRGSYRREGTFSRLYYASKTRERTHKTVNGWIRGSWGIRPSKLSKNL
nr:MAG TPA: hypothetical protein [Caudoviricetes sp.]